MSNKAGLANGGRVKASPKLEYGAGSGEGLLEYGDKANRGNDPGAAYGGR
ncbi:hypothetical protein [Bradyrhizobium icense]|nr:hypothetical protein [Bradyrhizobium icense]